MSTKESNITASAAAQVDAAIAGFPIHDLKNKHLQAFLKLQGIKEEDEGGRYLLITRFFDELEDDWNLEHRAELRETGVQKVFSVDDVRRYADVEGVTDESPQHFQDRLAFVEFLEGGGAA